MSNKAIVTLIIGAVLKEKWNLLCRENWRAYSAKHGCDLITYDEPIDRSERALKRSPSWQKLLLLSDPKIREFDQVAWFDCDIFFNPLHAPSIFDGVPIDKVGAVNSFEDPTPAENKIALERLWGSLRHGPGIAAVGEYWKPQDIYAQYGKPVQIMPKMLNAGVMVASPKHHAGVWQYVYERYEDQGVPSYYENVPLSYELVSRDLVYWLDPRFNHLWAWSKILHYPFLIDRGQKSLKERMLRRISNITGYNHEKKVAQKCATASLLNCHCLHFAGHSSEMSLVDLEMAMSKGCKNGIS